MLDKKEMCRNLWRECFHDSEAYMDYYFSEKWNHNIVLWEADDKAAKSMVHLNPYVLNFCGEQLKSYYIVGVATNENYRKQGKMRKLLEQSFSIMREEKIRFTFLMPADRKIYEPFGFQFLYTQTRYKLHNINMNIQDNKILAKTTDELTKEQWKQVLTFCKHKLEENFDLFVVREQGYYENLTKECNSSNGGVLFFFNGDEVIGILSYGKEQSSLEVTESLIDTKWTKAIIEKLLFIEREQELSFLESYFLNTDEFCFFTDKVDKEEVPIIMARVLSPSETFEQVLKGKRAYLNEIV